MEEKARGMDGVTEAGGVSKTGGNVEAGGAGGTGRDGGAERAGEVERAGEAEELVDARTIRLVDLDKVLARLSAAAGTGLGRELALSLRPSSDPAQVKRRQAETAEGRLLAEKGFSGYREEQDLRGGLDRLDRGGVLPAASLAQISEVVQEGQEARAFFREKAAAFPILTAAWVEAQVPGGLARTLDSAVSEAGEVKDAASPLLQSIRREMIRLRERIREKVEDILRSQAGRSYLQEPIVTLRGDRYVLPVKAEHQGQVPGIVHDASASGATVFIEPAPLVEMGNRLRALGGREIREIERILAELSRLARGHLPELRILYDLLGHLDFTLAKGRLSLEMDAAPPAEAPPARLSLLGARHPLIPRDRVVPVDVEIGTSFRTLIITGPNTGGKTVTLKIIGLLALMANSGLHLPARDGSAVGVFRTVRADIGDEQSIEQSLSTFSSHMTHIVKILAGAGPGDLILLDELGAGTDPAEGATLGMAILEHLDQAGCLTAATTHYSELKYFAFSREGMENASVEFDEVSLQPTYRLRTGLPGRSNAIAVAAHLGLPPAVLERAREFMGRERVRVEELLRSLEEDQRVAARERREAELHTLRLQELTDERQGEMRRLAGEAREVLSRSRQEAREIVARARRETESLIAELRTARVALREREALDTEEISRRRREKLDALASEVEESGRLEDLAGSGGLEGLEGLEGFKGLNGALHHETGQAGSGAGEPLGVGDQVQIIGVGQTGVVVGGPDRDGNFLVQVSSLKVNVPRDRLARPAKVSKAPRGSASTPVLITTSYLDVDTSAVSSEIHLRGLTVDLALADLDRYLDQAFIAGLGEVRVIHGKGTGTLRREVQRFLSSHPLVDSYRLGGHGEGSFGVTMVTLKRKR